eukprot:XP_006496653.1 PREDICTED: nuclear body protein SP140-like protein [Mus musculus]
MVGVRCQPGFTPSSYTGTVLMNKGSLYLYLHGLIMLRYLLSLTSKYCHLVNQYLLLHGNLSPRTIPEDQNEEESDDYQLMFKHFKENKVEIASAITKPFPFLMSLRDRDFISEQKFQEYQETCKNLVPLERVVYDILSNVQKKFSRDLLKVIFSKTHLKAYPEIRNQVHQL